MKSQEVAIKIVEKLDLLYGDLISQQEVRQVVEEVLYDYKIESKETALAIVDNMDNMILLYLATRKSEGLSDGTLKSYGRVLRKFANSIRKKVEDITAMDIRIYLINYSKTGVKNSTIATETNILRGFFNWLENEYRQFMAK